MNVDPLVIETQPGTASTPLLEVRDLKRHFAVHHGLLPARRAGAIRAVDDVSFSISVGETLGIVGESGSGKSTIAKLILGLDTPTSGSVRFRGQDISKLSSAERRMYRRSVAAVFQDPWSSLNPSMRVGDIVGEPLEINTRLSRSQIRARVQELLGDVGLRPEQMQLFPHEFSGGQRQRICIARALALDPALVVLDEPVSALDVSIRAQILNILKDLQRKYQFSYLLIAHDLATVRYLCHRVLVIYLGKIAEEGPSRALLDSPQHPYTRALISAALPARPDVEHEEIVLVGEIPSPAAPPSGCRFHTRCPQVMARCAGVEPRLNLVAPGRRVACYLYENETDDVARAADLQRT